MARGERTVRVPVALPEESRPGAWLRNFRLSGFALSLLLLVVAALLVLAAPLKTLIEQQQQIAELHQSVADAKHQVAVLNGEVDRWSDPSYIKSQARERLYYVMPGDVSFFIVGGNDNAASQDGLPISSEIQTTKVDWVRALLGTVYSAGLTTATPAQLDSPSQQDAK